MSIEADKLKELVDSVDNSATGIQQSIDKVQEQIDELQLQQDAFEFIMDECCNDLELTLLPEKGDTVYTSGDFRIENATDWFIGDVILNNFDSNLDNNFTRISNNEFVCNGDRTAEFDDNTGVIFSDGTTVISYTPIVSSEYNDGTTSVIVELAELTEDTNVISVVTYEYDGVGWDNNEEIQARIDEFDFALDYITHPVGMDGTYGTQDMINNLANTQGLLQSNKTKVVDSKTKLARFAST